METGGHRPEEHPGAATPEVAALDAAAQTHVVELSWRASRVHEALARLIDEGISWTGPQREIGRIAGYKSTHSVIDALDDLEEAGLLLRQAEGNGRLLTYYLRAVTPAGEPYVIRTQAPRAITGRDVIRAAGRRVDPLPPASPTYAATYAAPLHEPMQSASDQHGPSISSSSSSSTVQHDATPPFAAASPAGSDAGAPEHLDPREALIADRLRGYRIEPEHDIVQLIAGLPSFHQADVWSRIDRHHLRPPDRSTPEFVRRCVKSCTSTHPLPRSAPGSALASGTVGRRLTNALRGAVSGALRGFRDAP